MFLGRSGLSLVGRVFETPALILHLLKIIWSRYKIFVRVQFIQPKFIQNPLFHWNFLGLALFFSSYLIQF